MAVSIEWINCLRRLFRQFRVLLWLFCLRFRVGSSLAGTVRVLWLSRFGIRIPVDDCFMHLQRVNNPWRCGYEFFWT